MVGEGESLTHDRNSIENPTHRVGTNRVPKNTLVTFEGPWKWTFEKEDNREQNNDTDGMYL